MFENVIMFTGSQRDFDILLENEIGEEQSITYFMEIIQDYNAKLRPTTAYYDEERRKKYEIEHLVVKAEDFASVLEHVIQNFATIVTLNHTITNMYLHNPPKRIVRTIEAIFDGEIIYYETKYSEFDRVRLNELFKKLSKEIVGQNSAKQRIIAALYRLLQNDNDKPVVLMFLGPSGVGKTETAKCISDFLGGNLLRIQFSMMQTNEAYNYIFGSEHSKTSFAKELMGRETNIVLIDEFDKVSPSFFNAFYQLFDEGVYVDTHYSVDAKKCIFICTTNYENDTEAKKHLGEPIFSRFQGMIDYYPLSDNEKLLILDNTYKRIINSLQEDEKPLFDDNKVYDFFVKHIGRYQNIRILRSKLEDAIYTEIVNKFVMSI